MRTNSLALRLFLSAAGWTGIILLITGFLLRSLHRAAAERSFDRRLNVFLRTLVAEVAAPDDSSERTPQSLGEPQFDLPLSGWYWQLTRLNGGRLELRSSRSLWDSGLPHLADAGVAPTDDGTRRAYVPGPEDQRLRLIERAVDLGEDGRYLVAVAGDSQEIDDETHSFDRAIAATLGIRAAVLLLTTMFQVRFGLAPLKRISESLAAIRAGTAERLAGRFPVEIEPLARETNALIDANREIVERARTHVGNLAHALKTPLSVMMNEAAAHRGEPFAAKVSEQIEIMRDQVARHLERARLAAGMAAVIGTVTEVRSATTALARTMEKIHHDHGVVIDLDASEDAKFRGERQDFDEMMGNLVDNACKWAQSRVAIEIFSQQLPGPDRRRGVRLTVDDDGPGLSPSQREQVARRGRRLDETKPGSGLGLSIVVELDGLSGGRRTSGHAT